MPKLSPETKAKREQEKLAAYLGISVEELPDYQQEISDSNERTRNAQAVLLFLERPGEFISKKCDYCRGSFLTTYQFVSNCSDSCRRKSLERIGITWDPARTPEERWKRANIPTEYTVPPRALEILLEIAKDQATKEIDCDSPELSGPPSLGSGFSGSQDSTSIENGPLLEVNSLEDSEQVMSLPINGAREPLDALLQELDLE